jgi:hypothetical protein
VAGGALPMTAGTSFHGRRKPNGSAFHRRIMAAVQDAAKHDVVGVETYRHVELEVGGDLDAERRRRAEGHEPGRRVGGPARELLYAVQVDLDRARHRLGDGPNLDHAAGRVMLDQLELRLGIIACAEQLARGLGSSP